MSRGISITLSTIVIMVILLATLLAILFFFRGGFGESAGAIGDISGAAADNVKPSYYSPSTWFCRGDWYICEQENFDCNNAFGSGQCPYDDTPKGSYDSCMGAIEKTRCKEGREPGTQFLECKCR